MLNRRQADSLTESLNAVKRQTAMSKPNGCDVPVMLGVRPGELGPLLLKWRKLNPTVEWSELVRNALRRELAPLAKKRYAHLVSGARQSAATNGRKAA